MAKKIKLPSLQALSKILNNKYKSSSEISLAISKLADKVNSSSWPSKSSEPGVDLLEAHLRLSAMGCDFATQAIVLSEISSGSGQIAAQLLAAMAKTGTHSRGIPAYLKKIHKKSKAWAAFAGALWFTHMTGISSSQILGEVHSEMVLFPELKFEEAMQVYQAGRVSTEEWLDGIARFKWTLFCKNQNECRTYLHLKPLKS